jgi:hypothetical protein
MSMDTASPSEIGEGIAGEENSFIGENYNSKKYPRMHRLRHPPN